MPLGLALPDWRALPGEVEFDLSLALPPAAKVCEAMVELDARARNEDDFPVRFTDEDDFYTIVMKTSTILEAAGAEFVMSGFGNTRWPLDLSYDGSMVIEELPEFMADLVDGAATLQLSGQGVETDLVFEKIGEEFRISCVSGAEWVDCDITHHVDQVVILAMFDELARRFVHGLEMVDSEVAGRAPFASWRSA